MYVASAMSASDRAPSRTTSCESTVVHPMHNMLVISRRTPRVYVIFSPLGAKLGRAAVLPWAAVARERQNTNQSTHGHGNYIVQADAPALKTPIRRDCGFRGRGCGRRGAR